MKKTTLVCCLVAGVALGAPDGGVDGGVVFVDIAFERWPGDKVEGVVSLHARGETDECANGKTGPERTSTRRETDPLVRPRRQLTTDGGVRFVVRESVLDELPSEKALCIRYANGSATWDLKREAVIENGVVDLGTVKVNPPANPVSAVLACCSGSPRYDLSPELLQEHLDYIDELEAIGAKKEAKRARSDLLRAIGNVEFRYEPRLDPLGPRVKKLCGSGGCSNDEKAWLKNANQRLVAPVARPP